MSEQTTPPAGPPIPVTQEVARQQLERTIQAALQGPLPKFYANSFGIAYSYSDISVVMLMNNQVVGSLSMSHISAKSLAVDLMRTIEQFENATGQKVKTISEVNEDIQKSLGQPNASF